MRARPSRRVDARGDAPPLANSSSPTEFSLERCRKVSASPGLRPRPRPRRRRARRCGRCRSYARNSTLSSAGRSPTPLLKGLPSRPSRASSGFRGKPSTGVSATSRPRNYRSGWRRTAGASCTTRVRRPPHFVLRSSGASTSFSRSCVPVTSRRQRCCAVQVRRSNGPAGTRREYHPAARPAIYARCSPQQRGRRALGGRTASRSSTSSWRHSTRACSELSGWMPNTSAPN